MVNSASAGQQAQREEPNGEWGKGSACESGELGNTESRQDNGREPGDMGEEASQGGCGDDAADGAGEAMADSHRIDRSAPAEGREYDRQAGPAGEELGNTEGRDGLGSAQRDPGHAAQPNEGMGNTEEQRCWRLDDEQGEIGGRETRGHIDRASNSKQQGQWQIEPTLGRNFNEPSHWMDYAELSVSCDNRTDELRLLGNGVVPATASLAFRTLMNDLCSPES